MKTPVFRRHFSVTLKGRVVTAEGGTSGQHAKAKGQIASWSELSE